jgi:hypothetical protein
MTQHVGIAFNETQKNVYLLPFGNLSKLSYFIFFTKIKMTLFVLHMFKP